MIHLDRLHRAVCRMTGNPCLRVEVTYQNSVMCCGASRRVSGGRYWRIDIPGIWIAYGDSDLRELMRVIRKEIDAWKRTSNCKAKSGSASCVRASECASECGSRGPRIGQRDR